MRLFGLEPPAAAIPFIQDLLTSPRGWLLIFSGGLIGLCFAAVALCITLVSFPLMLDRDIGLVPAIVASMRLARENPWPVLLWGLIVAIGLALGAATLFIGLAFIVPVLGHATWRLYRRAVARDPRREVPMDTSDSKGIGEVKILKPLWTFLDLRSFLQKKARRQRLIPTPGDGDSLGDSRIGLDLIRCCEGWSFAMPLSLREDFEAGQARRLLALAAIYDRSTRTEAAKIGGVTIQIVRDWVMKFDAYGPSG